MSTVHDKLGENGKASSLQTRFSRKRNFAATAFQKFMAEMFAKTFAIIY